VNSIRWRLPWPARSIPAPTTTLPERRCDGTGTLVFAEPKHKRGFLFLTFAAKSSGYWDRLYADHPELPLQNAVAMINMDMIGRLRDARVSERRGHRNHFANIVKEANGNTGFEVDLPKRQATDPATTLHSPPTRCPILFFFSDSTATITSQRHMGQNRRAADRETAGSDRRHRRPAFRGSARPQLVRVAPPQEPAAPIRTRAVRYRATALTSAYSGFRRDPNGVSLPDIRPGSRRRRRALRLATFSPSSNGKPIQNLLRLYVRPASL